MRVRNFNFRGVGLSPDEANSPLIVDPNTVLPQSIDRQSLQTIPWNGPQIRERASRVNLVQLSLATAAIRWNFRLNSQRKTLAVSFSRNFRIIPQECYSRSFNATR